MMKVALKVEAAYPNPRARNADIYEVDQLRVRKNPSINWIISWRNLFERLK